MFANLGTGSGGAEVLSGGGVIGCLGPGDFSEGEGIGCLGPTIFKGRGAQLVLKPFLV